MNFKSMFRFIHSTPLVSSVQKSALAALRKKTGYTFANCKKALELHQNDITQVKSTYRESKIYAKRPFTNDVEINGRDPPKCDNL